MPPATAQPSRLPRLCFLSYREIREFAMPVVAEYAGRAQIEMADGLGDARYVWLPGTVESSEFLGEFTRYQVQIGEQRLTADQSHLAGLSPFPVGAPVSIGLEPTQVRLLAA